MAMFHCRWDRAGAFTGTQDFPLPTIPINTDARSGRKYIKILDHFLELIGMLLMISDSSYIHSRISSDILEDLTSRPDTKFLSESNCEGFRFLRDLTYWWFSRDGNLWRVLV